MIGKVKIGKTFPGICRYVFREDKHARVLAADGVRTEAATSMASDFAFQCQLRPRLGNAVLHVALSLPVEDAQGRNAEQLGDLFRRIGEAYVAGMGLGNTQWALVQHFDQPHPHAHLIANRVDNAGQVVVDQFIGQRSKRVCQAIEREMGLTVAEQRGREQAREVSPTHRQATAVTAKEHRLADWHRARHTIANALQVTAPYSSNFDELQHLLNRFGVRVQPITRKQHDTSLQVVGVTFEKDGQRVKGSEVGREYGAGKLQKAFAQVREQAPQLAQVAQTAEQQYTAEALAELFAQQGKQARQANEKTRSSIPSKLNRERDNGWER